MFQVTGEQIFKMTGRLSFEAYIYTDRAEKGLSVVRTLSSSST